MKTLWSRRKLVLGSRLKLKGFIHVKAPAKKQQQKNTKEQETLKIFLQTLLDTDENT